LRRNKPARRQTQTRTDIEFTYISNAGFAIAARAGMADHIRQIALRTGPFGARASQKNSNETT
jgi:hypothetical protein